MAAFGSRLGILLLVLAVAIALAPTAASASLLDGDNQGAPLAQLKLQRIIKDERDIAQTSSDAATLKADGEPADLLTRLAVDFARETADYRYRQAVRAEQADLLEIARDQDLTDDVVAMAPDPLASQIRDTIDAWHALWRLAGIDEFDKVRIHPRPLGSAMGSYDLAGLYHDAGSRYQVDWSILAAINFVESDFGRVNGPSSAGALGPMQFMPSTWAQYGSGDVNNPHDAIWAAARYLFLHGSLVDVGRAVFAYNHDWDYVTAIVDYATVMKRDGGWLDRFYYWNTLG
jgi:soluble lytic murein transglycosylase-like protein